MQDDQRRQGQREFQGGSATLGFQPMPKLSSNEELEEFANGVMGSLQERLNGHAEAICSRRRLLAIGVSSSRPSRVVDYSYDDIKEGCEQLSGKRAGCVWTHFMDITDREMRQLAESESKTALDAFSTRIFKEEGRNHVTVLAYTGEGVVRKRVTRVGQTIDSAYSQIGIMKSHRSLRATFPLPEHEFPGQQPLD